MSEVIKENTIERVHEEDRPVVKREYAPLAEHRIEFVKNAEKCMF